MATSLTSTGVVFPDATVQTTAATSAGGTLEAVASGSLSDGSTVVVNADGTVSVVAGVAQAVGTPVVFEAASANEVSITFDSTSNKVVIAYKDVGNSNYGTAIVGAVSGTSISFGTPVVFESASTNETSSIFDSANQKIIIAYSDGGNSDFGTAIVGTVSGTSISFGTPVVFESASTNEISATYNSANSKAVIVYRDLGNSFYGTAIVGTVSGTSISFGTAVVFESANTTSISSAFDFVNNKVVIAYEDRGNSNFGTAIIGTVSGTSISFGTAVVFESASTNSTSTVFDSTNNKIVIAYTDSGNSSYGTAIVGTVSGTSISFGAAIVFENAATGGHAAVYDPVNNKIMIAYQDAGNSNFGTIVVGVVSGTSIGFGAPFVFENATTISISAVYDSTNNKVVIAYRDSGNSGYGTSVVFQNESTNLTAENFIGISDGAYTNGQTATVLIAGSVSAAQTGLTAGQSYYVQSDGTISTTPGDPSVFAGTAIAATKLLVQG